MIIECPDKKKIINFERITEVIVSDKDICVRDNFEVQKGLIIATYESEERAKEVFQEIISKYKTTSYNSRTNETVVNIPKAYEMPIT